MKRALLATALLCAAVSAADAANVLACKQDAIRFCGATKDDFNAGMARKIVIGICLLNHRPQLRKGCDALLKSYGY